MIFVLFIVLCTIQRVAAFKIHLCNLQRTRSRCNAK